jgi:2-polyprenyl-3-methyl-5-hydroxy-6-metoxy-1,4-benzoquinol methylase
VRAATETSIRFVFDSVVDDCAAGRLDQPAEAIVAAAWATRIGTSSRVLEIGAGGGQLTVGLRDTGFDVLALSVVAARAQG